MRARLRAFAGLWTLVGLLGTAMVLTAAAAGPMVTKIEDDGLRQQFADAPYTSRDLISTRVATSPDEATRMEQTLQGGLAPELQTVVRSTWTYHYTQVAPGSGIGAGLTGDGVTVSDNELAPVVSLHQQEGLVDEVTVVQGRAPTTDPAGDVVEVMVAAEVAANLGLGIDHDYDIYPGALGLFQQEGTGEWAVYGGMAPQPLETDPIAVRVVGLWTADDPTAPMWDHLPQVRRVSSATIPVGDPPHPRALRGGLVTDRDGFGSLLERDTLPLLGATAGVRMRIDEAWVDAAWADGGHRAAVRAQSDPALRDTPVQSGLPDLLSEFERRAAAVRAVLAVAAAGVLATLAGLLVLAARLITERRRPELELLRARGGSLAAVGARLTAEALPVALLAGAAGWLLHRWVNGEPLSGLPAADDGSLRYGVVVLVLAWLTVPVAGMISVRHHRLGGARTDVGRSARPARLTVELCVLLLAGAGVLLVRQRGLATEGVDPFLSAVPVLLGISGGLLALRLYPWPLRALAALARRLRGTVGFVGFARAGRAAPGAALALLVLALSVAAGGFVAAVDTGVAAARADGAVQSVGAHVRVSSERLPEGAAASVSAVPGVEAVAVSSRGGVARESPVRHGNVLPARDVPGAQVVAVDAAAYQRMLDALGTDVRLPEELLAAGPDDDPLPVLAAPAIGERHEPQVRIGDVERDIVAVGRTAHLPGPDGDGAWMLVPAQAMPELAPDPDGVNGVTEQVLLVAGAGADPEAVRAAVAELPGAGQVSVTSTSDFREELDASGFNAGLTLALVVGTAAALAGGVLAVGMALVVQARARGHVLSLLRTMGLSNAQARALLLVELLPLAALAVAAGAVVGAATPLLLATALGLDEFTGGTALTFGVAPGSVAAFAALVAAAVLVGTTVEVAVNRRLGLGSALRLE